MKAESIPTTRNRSAFYAYRKRPSPSPSVCSSASSSIASASASASSRSASRPTGVRRKSSTNLGNNNNITTTGNSNIHPALKQRQNSRQGSVPLPSTSAGPSREFEALLEPEYQEDVLVYMAEMAEITSASVELIDQQPELAWYMRPYLIDFLVEIHSQYRLRPETLYLAVNISDRYTSKRIVYKRHYQLVGCAALWIAAKFEDAKDRVPTVQDLCAMTCNAYDASAFIQMEGHVLSTLDWLVGHPTAEAWLRVASIHDPTLLTSDAKLQHVARFLMEITLFHRAFVPLKSSDVALGCLLLARFLMNKPRRPSEETPLAIQIAQMLDGHLAEHLEQVSAIVVKKYSLPCFSNASKHVREWYLASHRFKLEAWPRVPAVPIVSTFAAATLTPLSHPLRRDSSSSQFSTSPSSLYHEGSSSDDEDLPLTPSTPLTAYSTEEPESMQRPSPTLYRNALHQHAKAQLYKESRRLTPPTSAAAKIQVTLEPTSGPSMTLC